jgi:hypothetical protein
MDPNEQPADDASKIQIDSDWKQEAEAEREKLNQEAEEIAADGGAAPPIPPVDLDALVTPIMTQALFYLGAVPDPMTGQRILHMEMASHNIDLLGFLGEKTKGNLSEDESKRLEQMLHELRMLYAQMQKQVAAQAAKQGDLPGGDPDAAPGGDAPPAGGGIQMP